MEQSSKPNEFLTGIHVQAPWSELILTGKKTVETRNYPLPQKFINIPLALIETPGYKKLCDKTMIRGIVIFEDFFKYQNRTAWENDFQRHLVDISDPQFGFSDGKEKWGWKVSSVHIFDTPQPPPKKRSIIYAKNCEIQYELYPLQFS